MYTYGRYVPPTPIPRRQEGHTERKQQKTQVSTQMQPNMYMNIHIRCCNHLITRDRIHPPDDNYIRSTSSISFTYVGYSFV